LRDALMMEGGAISWTSVITGKFIPSHDARAVTCGRGRAINDRDHQGIRACGYWPWVSRWKGPTNWVPGIPGFPEFPAVRGFSGSGDGNGRWPMFRIPTDGQSLPRPHYRGCRTGEIPSALRAHEKCQSELWGMHARRPSELGHSPHMAVSPGSHRSSGRMLVIPRGTTRHYAQTQLEESHVLMTVSHGQKDRR
jgi:hypothetical protein